MRPWPYPKLVAHRGGGSLAPENTLAALRLGASLGYSASEFDVKLSRDGIAYLLHDATLDRTTDGKGPVGDLDWPALAVRDAGSWHSDAFRGEAIPTLEAVAAFVVGQGLRANVEIKPVPGAERKTGHAVALACERLWKGAPVAPLLSSFSFEALEAAFAAAPALARGWLVEVPQEEDFDRLERLEATALHCSHKAVTPALVARVHGAGRRLLAWTVNDPDRAAVLFGLGVDSVVTDNLAVFGDRFPSYR